jgi:hypothetical protein
MDIPALEAKSLKSPYTFNDDGDFKFFDEEATVITKDAFFTQINTSDKDLINTHMGKKSLQGGARPNSFVETGSNSTVSRASKYSQKEHEDF